MSTRASTPSPRRSRQRLAGQRLAGIAVASLAAACVAFSTPPANAQQVMRMTVSGGPGMFGGMARPAMTPKELEGYTALLTMDDTQKDAAKELLSSYTTDFEKASKEQAEKVKKLAEEFRESHDDEVWEQMGPINEKYSKRTKELEASLISDLKSLCTDQQLSLWPKFERTRRRDRTIDRGSVSGESVDLVHLVGQLDLTGQTKADVAQQLEAYEQDLDKALVERNKILDEQAAAFKPGRGRQEFDMEKWQKQMQDARDAGAKVRDVNQRYARSIESLLPDAVKAKFALDVKRASFPIVYKQSRAQRAFDAALKFDDLDSKQKEAITSLRQSYEHEADSLNDKWAAAIMDEEKEGGGGAIMGGGGAVMMVSFGDDDSDKPSAQARKARREADKKAVQSLQALLSEEQKSRLPTVGDDGPAQVGGQFIIGDK